VDVKKKTYKRKAPSKTISLCERPEDGRKRGGKLRGTRKDYTKNTIGPAGREGAVRLREVVGGRKGREEDDSYEIN